MKIEIVKSKGDYWVVVDGWWERKFETLGDASNYFDEKIRIFSNPDNNGPDEVIKSIEI